MIHQQIKTDPNNPISHISDPKIQNIGSILNIINCDYKNINLYIFYEDILLQTISGLTKFYFTLSDTKTNSINMNISNYSQKKKNNDDNFLMLPSQNSYMNSFGAKHSTSATFITHISNVEKIDIFNSGFIIISEKISIGAEKINAKKFIGYSNVSKNSIMNNIRNFDNNSIPTCSWNKNWINSI